MFDALLILAIPTVIMFAWMWMRSMDDRARKAVAQLDREEYLAQEKSFKVSPEYDLVIRFARRFPDESYADDDIASLHELIAPYWSIPGVELRRLVRDEIRKQENEACRSYLQAAAGATRNAYLHRYMDRYGSESQRYAHVLYGTLRQAGLLRDEEKTPADLQTVLSALAQRRKLDGFRARLLQDDAAPWPNIDQLEGTQFEELVGRLMTKMGYEVATTPATGDQGCDLIVQKFGEKTVVQVKRWEAPVGNSAVQEVVAAVKFYHGHHAMVVTSGSFTRSAEALAEANNVALVDRSKLTEWVQMYW